MPQIRTLNPPPRLTRALQSIEQLPRKLKLLLAAMLALLAVAGAIQLSWRMTIAAMGETTTAAPLAAGAAGSAESTANRDADAASATAQHRRFHGPSAAAVRSDAERRQQVDRLKRRQREAAAKALASRQTSPAEGQPQEDMPGATSTAESQSPADLTLRFWRTLNGVIERESSERGTPLASTLRDEEQAKEFLNRRSSAATAAADAVHKSDRAGVDAEVLAIADRLASWYDDSVRVAQHGSGVLGAPSKERRSTAGKSWQSEEQALARKAVILNQEAENVRTRMAKKYGVVFPILK